MKTTRLIVLALFVALAVHAGFVTGPVTGGIGNTNALTTAQSNLLANAVQGPMASYNLVSNNYIGRISIQSATVTNLMWPDGNIFIPGGAFGEMYYDQGGMFFNSIPGFIYGIGGEALINLNTGAFIGNGALVTNTPSSTVTSSNGTVTVAISKNPATGETNYDLASSGGGGGSTTNFGGPIFFTNSPTTSVAGIPELSFAGTNGVSGGTNSLTVGIGNWYGSNSIGYFQSAGGPISFDLLPLSGTTNMANLDLCAWFDPVSKQGQYADIAIRLNSGAQTMFVGGVGSGAPTPGLWLDSQEGGIKIGANAYLSIGDYAGYQNILAGMAFQATGNFTTYAGYGSTVQIAAGGVDPSGVGWLAWAFINNTNHDLQLVPNGGYVSVNGYLTATNGIGSLNTNATLVVTSAGITNTSGLNYRFFGFTGSSVTQTNPISGIGFSRGTITVPTDIMLQPGEHLNGSSCAAAAGQAF